MKTEILKSGIQLISHEREKQLSKGRTIEDDIKYNTEYQLSIAANRLLSKSLPNDEEGSGLDYLFKELEIKDWDMELFGRMFDKNYQERLIIAGALIAAELDRINQTK